MCESQMAESLSNLRRCALAYNTNTFALARFLAHQLARPETRTQTQDTCPSQPATIWKEVESKRGEQKKKEKERNISAGTESRKGMEGGGMYGAKACSRCTDAIPQSSSERSEWSRVEQIPAAVAQVCMLPFCFVINRMRPVWIIGYVHFRLLVQQDRCRSMLSVCLVSPRDYNF